MNKLVALLLVLGLAFLAQYLWQRYKVPRVEDVLADIDAPDALVQHSKEFSQRQIIKVTDGVYMAIGFAIANSILLEAPEGLIIVDTTENVEAAREVLQEFRKISVKPIKAIIYTHYHIDHVAGTEVFIEGLENIPDIWAHHTTMDQFKRQSRTAMITRTRGVRQLGPFLSPKEFINGGIGPRMRFPTDDTLGLVYPNKFLNKDEEDHIVAGLHLRLVHIPGETSDQIGVWLPEKKVFLCGDDLYRTFPNLYAIRGAPTRDTLVWVRSLDKMRHLKPEYLVPSHTRSIIGQQHVYEVLTNYRDGIQFVHDQTVRYMNRGMHPEEIAKLIKLPEQQLKNPFLKEFYGTVRWSVKAVFNYLGWFSGDPVELNPITPSEKAQKMIELVGGSSKILEKAKSALIAGDYQWALELASYVVNVDASDIAARDIRIEAMKALASKQTSANGRNYYLTYTMEDLKALDNRFKLPKRHMMRMPMQYMMQALSLRLKAEECEGIRLTAVFNFTDIDDVYVITIRNSVAEVEKFSAEDSPSLFDVKLSIPSGVWREIVAQVRSAAAADDFVVEGGVLNLYTFMGYFERFKE